jgi:uncharacterized membrane protein YhaH (DUF805 family)
MSDRPPPPGLAVLLACVPWVVSGLVLVASLFFGLLAQCDESCTGDGWRHTAGAWQWDLIPLLGLVAFVAGTTLLVSVWRRRPRRAFTALLVGTVAALAVAGGLQPFSHDELARHPKTVGACALIFFAGLFASLLCAPGEPGGEATARTD